MSETNGSEGQQGQEVQCLFIVVLDQNGQSRVVLDPEARFVAQRLATSSDVYPSLANCLADYAAIKTAEAILTFQAQIANQLRTQAPQEEADEKMEGRVRPS